ncbi:MAG: DUF4282 domain-containing protein [Nostocoides sp.]
MSDQGNPPPPPQNPYENQPTAGYAAGQAPAPTGGGPVGNVGFFGALFDFSFNNFVTPKLVRALYLLGTVLLAVLWLFWVIAGFTQSAAVGLMALIIGPFVLIIYLAFFRMTLEFYLAVVRMSEDIHQRLR